MLGSLIGICTLAVVGFVAQKIIINEKTNEVVDFGVKSGIVAFMVIGVIQVIKEIKRIN